MSKEKLSVYLPNSKKMHIGEVRYWSLTCISFPAIFSIRIFEPQSLNYDPEIFYSQYTENISSPISGKHFVNSYSYNQHYMGLVTRKPVFGGL